MDSSTGSEMIGHILYVCPINSAISYETQPVQEWAQDNSSPWNMYSVFFSMILPLLGVGI